MTKKKLLKTFALGLCMSSLFAGTMNMGTAYAQSGGGVSPSFGGTYSQDYNILYEKQKELDQVLFVDNAKEIEKRGFKVIYTGVADNYVEVGISPYSEENAAYLYGLILDDQVKIVASEEIVPYIAPDEGGNAASPVDSDTVVSPVMDMGDDTPVSNESSDEALIKEREKLLADEAEELTIQIESVEGSEPVDSVAPELIRQTAVTEDLPETDDGIAVDADIQLVSAQDDMVKTTAVNNIENEDKGLPTASITAIVAAGALIIAGTAYASVKKKDLKKTR